MLAQQKREEIAELIENWSRPYSADVLSRNILERLDATGCADIDEEDVAEVLGIVCEMDELPLIADADTFAERIRRDYATLTGLVANRDFIPYGFASGHDDSNDSSIYAHLTQTSDAVRDYPEIFECDTIEEVFDTMIARELPPWSWIVNAFCRYANIDTKELDAAYGTYVREGGNEDVLADWKETADMFGHDS